MSENVLFRNGDKVLIKKIAENGQIWIVGRVDQKNKRCHIRRITPDRIFKRIMGFSSLILEVDLPRRIPLDMPSLKLVNKDKEYGMILTLERMVSLLKIIHANPSIKNAELKQQVMPETQIRTMQRHIKALCDEGYLIKKSIGPHTFKVTLKAIKLLNLKPSQVIELKTLM